MLTLVLHSCGSYSLALPGQALPLNPSLKYDNYIIYNYQTDSYIVQCTQIIWYKHFTYVGLLHCLSLYLTPPPQVLLHGLYDPNSLQPPFTGVTMLLPPNSPSAGTSSKHAPFPELSSKHQMSTVLIDTTEILP